MKFIGSIVVTSFLSLACLLLTPLSYACSSPISGPKLPGSWNIGSLDFTSAVLEEIRPSQGNTVELLFRSNEKGSAQIVLKRPKGLDIEWDRNEVLHRDHRDPAFWLGISSNGFIAPDCSVGYSLAVGEEYLLFPGAIGTLFAVEPVRDPESDIWSQHVRRYRDIGNLWLSKSTVLGFFDQKLDFDCTRSRVAASPSDKTLNFGWRVRVEVSRLCDGGPISKYEVYADQANPLGVDIILALPVLPGLGVVQRDAFGSIGRAFNELP